MSQESEKDFVRRYERGDATHRHPFYRNNLITTYQDGITTVYEAFLQATSKWVESPCLGTREMKNGVAGPYKWVTFTEFEKMVCDLSAGLASLGLKRGAIVGIHSRNCLEWIITEYACHRMAYVPVPLYDTLGEEAISYILEQTEMKVIVGSVNHIEWLCKARDSFPHMKTFIYINGEVRDDLKKLCSEVNIELLRYDLLLSRGAEEPIAADPPTAEDLFTICYTSGTSGTPKGALLTHANVLSCISASLLLVAKMGADFKDTGHKWAPPIDSNTVHLSYLPLAHVYERIITTTSLVAGSRIGFYQGDINKLMEDAQELKPTLFVTVPRLLTRIHDKVHASVGASPIHKRGIFSLAYNWKLENLKKHDETQHWLWDRLVFNAIRQKLGGCVKDIISGSAPLDEKVKDFCQLCFGCQITQGYGQTETCAITTIQEYGYPSKANDCGYPNPCVEIKLQSVPEMNYSTEDKPFPRGEVLIRGPACFKGYYKLDEITKETIDEEGWVRSGDIGYWDEDGRLVLIDRKKNIFKMAQGEYIAPEKIERVLESNIYIAQIFVYGNSRESHVVAALVPDFEILGPWAKKEGIEYSNQTELATHPDVHTFLLAQLQGYGRSGSGVLKGFEIPLEILVEPEPFTIENGLLTSTMKLKRFQARQKYERALEELYTKTKSKTRI